MSTLTSSDSHGVRARYREFVERHEVAWELFFAALAVVFVALAFLPTGPGGADEATVLAIEWIITLLFVGEFTSRLWAAPVRPSYVRDTWWTSSAASRRYGGSPGSDCCDSCDWFAPSLASGGR